MTDVVADGIADPDDRHRVRGRRGGHRRGPLDGPRRLRQHQLRQRPVARSWTGRPTRYAVIDAGTNSIKFHVGERGAGGDLADASSTGPRSPGSARGSRRRGAISPTPRSSAPRRPIAGHGRRGARPTARSRSPPSAPPACGSREPGRGRRGHRAPDRRPRRGDLGRGGEPPRLPAPCRPACGLGRGLAGRLRHRRREHAAHVRATATASTSASAWTWARSATRSASASTGAVTPEVLRRGAGRDRRGPHPPRRPAVTPTRWSWAWAAP